MGKRMCKSFIHKEKSKPQEITRLEILGKTGVKTYYVLEYICPETNYRIIQMKDYGWSSSSVAFKIILENNSYVYIYNKSICSAHVTLKVEEPKPEIIKPDTFTYQILEVFQLHPAMWYTVSDIQGELGLGEARVRTVIKDLLDKEYIHCVKQPGSLRLMTYNLRKDEDV